MSIVVYAAAVIVALIVAYAVQFSAATLAMGRALSESDSTTGFQDAITPPWQTNFALAGYIGILCVVAFAWWRQGWVTAVGVLVTLFVATLVWQRLLPAPGSEHFRIAIVRSMLRRYADFVRKGDAIRAEAMKMMLRRAGIDPEVISGA